MGKKRPHSDGEPSGHGVEDGARKRPRIKRPHKSKTAAANTDSLSAIKKRARAIERLLARDNLKLPANKQNDLERELVAHKQRIEDIRFKKERSKMIAKYHMVRFFERKKATRFAKQLEKKAAQATDPEEVAQLKADLHVAQVDIDYARYFPFMEPYVSLYAAAAAGEKEAANTAAHYLRTSRPPMWAVIEKTREEGQAALERLQNRRPQTSSNSETTPKPVERTVSAKQSSSKKTKGTPKLKSKTSARGKPNKTEEEQTDSDSDSDDSDGGGFFEED
ncbi:hypothetical protein N657DRAFT_656061 [Parathielavia appendiculata]|uniref:rRNA-processing protein EFG1 n=1 Tax=Parathielavia appendiculata TaxID=2587402 RepID=A0AAN6Z3A7_9PEZI|nr:hypothetical protein N657DRAFT_656061 [Parathielavia appendiculata]